MKHSKMYNMQETKCFKLYNISLVYRNEENKGIVFRK